MPSSTRPKTSSAVRGTSPSHQHLKTWIYGVRGTVDDAAVKVLFPVFAAALLGIVYGALHRRYGVALSLLGTAFLASMPVFSRVALKANADLAMAMFCAATACLVWDYLETREHSRLVLGALVAAGLMFTKNEGTPVFSISLVVLGTAMIRPGRQSRLLLARHIAAYLVLAGALSVPWHIFRSGIPKTHRENYGARLMPAHFVEQIGNAPFILRCLGESFVDLRPPQAKSRAAAKPVPLRVMAVLYFRLPFLLPLAALLLLLPSTLRPPPLYLLLWTFLHAAAYFAAYTVLPGNHEVMRQIFETSSRRIFIHLAPVATMLVIACIGSQRQRYREEVPERQDPSPLFVLVSRRP